MSGATVRGFIRATANARKDSLVCRAIPGGVNVGLACRRHDIRAYRTGIPERVLMWWSAVLRVKGRSGLFVLPPWWAVSARNCVRRCQKVKCRFVQYLERGKSQQNYLEGFPFAGNGGPKWQFRIAYSFRVFSKA